MFSLRLLRSGGLRLRHAWRRGCQHLQRGWVHHCAQCIWPPSNEDTQASVHTFDHRSPFYMENMVDYLARAVQRDDYLFISTFLAIYPKFTTTSEVLDLVMKRYPSFHPNCKEDQKEKKAIAFFLELWIERLPLDFCDCLDLAKVDQLLAYVSLNMPSSNLAARVQLLLPLMEDEGCKNANPKDEEACVSDPAKPGTSGLQAQHDASGMPEGLQPGPASVAVPQGKLPPQKDTVNTVNMQPIVTATAEPVPVLLQPCVSMVDETAPEVMEPSHEPLPTAVGQEQPLAALENTDPPLVMAADTPASGQEFQLSTQLTEPHCVCPLPDVNI